MPGIVFSISTSAPDHTEQRHVLPWLFQLANFTF